MCPSLLIDKNTNQVGSCRTISARSHCAFHFQKDLFLYSKFDSGQTCHRSSGRNEDHNSSGSDNHQEPVAWGGHQIGHRLFPRNSLYLKYCIGIKITILKQHSLRCSPAPSSIGTYGGLLWAWFPKGLSSRLQQNVGHHQGRGGKTCGRCGPVRANFFHVLC